MKKIITTACIFCMLILGCAPQNITDDQFTMIWKEYLTREFKESFDEKQSAAQRKNILESVLREYNIQTDTFMAYMKEQHPDKYRTIFYE
ncbi:MAG: hypothetical protein ACOCX9_04270 [Spirochaetota bacterium]